MSRKRPVNKLSKCPLVLVLAQVRFSSLMAMEEYIPRIQDRLRQAGYKINVSTQIQEVTFTAQGSKATAHPHWEFQNQDRTESVVINPGFLVFQTTKYDVFEQFLPKITEAARIVDEVVNGIVVQRVGLRYLDLIRPKAGETWQRYLETELHGINSSVFKSDTVEQIHQTAGQTDNGKLVLRIWQNRIGAALPPDLAAHQLSVPVHAQNLGNELATIVDLDHYREGMTDDFSAERLSSICWALKNDITEIFEDSIVTAEAMEAWR